MQDEYVKYITRMLRFEELKSQPVLIGRAALWDRKWVFDGREGVYG